MLVNYISTYIYYILNIALFALFSLKKRTLNSEQNKRNPRHCRFAHSGAGRNQSAEDRRKIKGKGKYLNRFSSEEIASVVNSFAKKEDEPFKGSEPLKG